MAHNEIVGWDGGSDAGRFSAIFLQDSDQHPREHERVEKTAEVIAGARRPCCGSTPRARPAPLASCGR